MRSGVTLKVNLNEGIKLGIHAAFIVALSGQLRFLGSVSLQEFLAQGGFEQAFHEGDANGDKQLNSDEYAKAVASNDRIKASR